MKMLLTKKFAFEMAHALDGYDGKCANLHGHSYHLEVTVEAPVLGADGMAIDFGRIKQIVQQAVVDRFDHALVLSEKSKFRNQAPELDNLVLVPFNPTTENLLIHFVDLVSPHMPDGVVLHSLRLAETDTSVAELLLAD